MSYNDVPFARFWKNNYKYDSCIIPFYKSYYTENENRVRLMTFISRYNFYTGWNTPEIFNLRHKENPEDDRPIRVEELGILLTGIDLAKIPQMIEDYETDVIYYCKKGGLELERIKIEEGKAIPTGYTFRHIFDVECEEDIYRKGRPLQLPDGIDTEIISVVCGSPLFHIAFSVVPYGKRNWKDNLYRNHCPIHTLNELWGDTFPDKDTIELIKQRKENASILTRQLKELCINKYGEVLDLKNYNVEKTEEKPIYYFSLK